MGIRFVTDPDDPADPANTAVPAVPAEPAPVVDEAAAAQAALLDTARAEATAAAQADIAAIIEQAVTAAVAAAITAVKADAYDAMLEAPTDLDNPGELGGEAASTAELPDDAYNDDFGTSAISSLFERKDG